MALWGPGDNFFGQLGDKTRDDRLEPVKIEDDVVAVSAGGDHTMFIKNDGTLWGMGRNNRGQLGDGTRNDRLAPVEIIW